MCCRASSGQGGGVAPRVCSCMCVTTPLSMHVHANHTTCMQSVTSACRVYNTPHHSIASVVNMHTCVHACDPCACQCMHAMQSSCPPRTCGVDLESPSLLASHACRPLTRRYSASTSPCAYRRQSTQYTRRRICMGVGYMGMECIWYTRQYVGGKTLNPKPLNLGGGRMRQG